MTSPTVDPKVGLSHQHGMSDMSGVLKGGEVQRAVECCVALSQWDQAVALAQQYSIPQVQSLLFKYAAMLLDQHKTMEAVQLYKKVNFQPPPPSPSPPTLSFPSLSLSIISFLHPASCPTPSPHPLS